MENSNSSYHCCIVFHIHFIHLPLTIRITRHSRRMIRRDTASNASSSTLGCVGGGGGGEGEGGGSCLPIYCYCHIDVSADDPQRSHTCQSIYTYNSHIRTVMQCPGQRI